MPSPRVTNGRVKPNLSDVQRALQAALAQQLFEHEQSMQNFIDNMAKLIEVGSISDVAKSLDTLATPRRGPLPPLYENPKHPVTPPAELQTQMSPGTPALKSAEGSDAAAQAGLESAKDAVGDDPEEEAILLQQGMTLRLGSGLASIFTHDDDPDKPPYEVTDFYYKTGFCQMLARNNHFNNFTVFIVILNAMYIGIDADHNPADNIWSAAPFFIIASNLFTVYFTFEVVVRFFAFEKKNNAFKDGWFKFDLFLVVTMILDIWVIMVILKSLSGSKVSIPTQPLRMMRLFKLTRMARLMSALPELIVMIKGLLRSLRGITSAGILIGIMVYTFAIMLQMLLKDEVELNKQLKEEAEMNFETVMDCMWILLMDGTLMLDNAAPMMTRLLWSDKFNQKVGGIAFVFYAALSCLLVLQMLIGVLCDVVSRVGAEQRDAQAIGIVKQELLHIIAAQDVNGNGLLSYGDIEQVTQHPQAFAVLKKLNISRLYFLELAKLMFSKAVTEIPIREILELLIRCKGDNLPSVEALAGSTVYLASELDDIKANIAGVSKSVNSMQLSLSGEKATHWK